MPLRKYEPKTIKEFVGNATQLSKIRNYINSVLKKKKAKPLMIYGSPGVGKSLSVKLLAKELNLELIKLYDSDLDSPNSIFESIKQKSIFFRKRLVVIEINSGLRSTQIIKKIINVGWPVIFITDDAFAPKLKNIRSLCELVKFQKIRKSSIKKYLETIGEKKSLSMLVNTSCGDIRASLIDMLCALNSKKFEPGEREIRQQIFETIKIIFKTKKLENVRIAINNSDKPIEEIIMWLYENLPYEYEGTDLADAYEILSLIDIYMSRIIKRQSWTLKKYIPDLTAAISLAKTSQYKKFVMYKYPSLFGNYKKDGQLIKDLAKGLHMSRKKAVETLPLAKKIYNNISLI